MTLHEAIRLILMEKKAPMRAEELLTAIKAKGLYSKKDGSALSVNQIYARVASNKELFSVRNGEIYLTSKLGNSFVNVSWRIKSFLRTGNIQSEILIPFLLVFFRFSQKKKKSTVFPSLSYENFRKLSTIEKRNQLLDLVKELREPYFAETTDVINTSLVETNLHELDDIFWLLDDINSSSLDISDPEFEKIFEDILLYFSGWRTSQEFKTPDPVVDYISTIVHLKNKDTLCDPFAGHGGLIAKIIKENTNVTAVLQDFNLTVVLLGKLNMLVRSIDTQFIFGNSFHPRGLLSTKKYSWIITHPPFGMMISPSSLQEEYLKIKSNSGDGAIVQLVLSLLSNDGKAVIVLPESFFFGMVCEKLRKFLMERDFIEAVHSLPAGVFAPQTGIKTSILILNKSKNKSAAGRVTFKEVGTGKSERNQDQLLIFKDTAKQYERIVDLQEIAENDFILSVNRYLNVKEFGPEYFPIKELVTKIKKGTHIPKHTLGSQGKVPFITISNLANSKVNNTLVLEDIEQFLDSTELTNGIVKQECVLIADHGVKLKPTYFKGRQPIAINLHILALFVKKELILPQYLIHQLNQNYVAEQLEKIRGGTVIPFVRQKDLLEIRINVPPIEQQQKELSALTDILSQGDFPEAHFNLHLNRSGGGILKPLPKVDEERKLLSSIKHEFANLKAIVDGDVDLVKSFIDKKIKNSTLFTWDDTISSKPGARSVHQVFDNISKTLGQMGAAFPRLQQIIDFQKENLKKEPVKIVSFIREQVAQLQNQLIEVKVSYKLNGEKIEDQSDVDVLIDKNQFATVVQNFIFNSIKHGFVDEYSEYSTILFDIAKSDDELSVEIKMMNNGKPFQENFTVEDFKSFGVKSGSDGSGIGGYLMDQVVKNHGGQLELMNFEADQVIWLEPEQNKERKDKVLADAYSMFWPSIGFKVTLPIE